MLLLSQQQEQAIMPGHLCLSSDWGWVGIPASQPVCGVQCGREEGARNKFGGLCFQTPPLTSHGPEADCALLNNTAAASIGSRAIGNRLLLLAKVTVGPEIFCRADSSGGMSPNAPYKQSGILLSMTGEGRKEGRTVSYGAAAILLRRDGSDIPQHKWH